MKARVLKRLSTLLFFLFGSDSHRGEERLALRSLLLLVVFGLTALAETNEGVSAEEALNSVVFLIWV